RREDDAGGAPAEPAAPAGPAGVAGGDRGALGGRPAPHGQTSDRHGPPLRPAPRGHAPAPRRRRPRHRPARGGLALPQRNPLPRRDPGVHQPRPGRTAPAAGVRPRRDRPQLGRGALPGPVPDGAGRQPLPLRALLADRRFLRLPALREDRKSTRLNSSHVKISYAVFCSPPTPATSPLSLHDALPISEFTSHALDALRQPLESGHVVIARSSGVVRFPARFLMVLAANPCPCGRFSLTDGSCDCPPSAIRRYQARLSGPLLDRVDLRVVTDRVTRAELTASGARGESTATVAARVRAARERAATRSAGTPWHTNSDIPGRELRSRWRAAPGAMDDAERSLERGVLTARGIDRVLRVAWTVADLVGH